MPHPRFEVMSRDDVIRAARELKPKPVREWGCVVVLDGRETEFPVKQLFKEAANQVASTDPKVTPADFISHFAADRLTKLGFEVRYHG